MFIDDVSVLEVFVAFFATFLVEVFLALTAFFLVTFFLVTVSLEAFFVVVFFFAGRCHDTSLSVDGGYPG